MLTIFCPGLSTRRDLRVLSHWSGVKLGSIKERVVVGAALLRVEV